MMKLGKCELCHFTRDLHDSHFLPKGGYKRSRAKHLRNPNPIIISAGKAKQSSLQMRDYKFCGECEGKLNHGGEAFVLASVPSDYGEAFLTHDVIKNAEAIRVSDDLFLFPAKNISQIDLQKLVYFGMSMFWRATLDWSPVDGGIPPKVFMSLRQEKAIRKYLLGQGDLPRDVALTVAVWPFDKVQLANMVPRPDPTTPYRRYWFYFSGFIFLLALGNKIPVSIKKMCAHRSKVLTFSKELGQFVWESLKKQMNVADKSSIEKTLQEIALIRSKTSSKA